MTLSLSSTHGVPPNFRSLIGILSAQPSDHLTNLIKLANADGATMQTLTQGSELEKDTLAKLVSEAISFHSAVILNRPNIPSDDLVDDLIRGYSNENDCNKQNKEAITTFVKLAKSNVIKSATKYLRLAYDHPRLLETLRVTVDARPVFDDERSSILNYIVLSTLVLSFLDDGEEKTLQLKIDTSDIDLIINSLETAKKKIKVLEDSLKNISDSVRKTKDG